MTPQIETKADAKDPAASKAQRRAKWRRYGLPASLVALCAALAAGGYYAWHAWFGQDDASAGVVTAVAVRGNLEDVVTATGTLKSCVAVQEAPKDLGFGDIAILAMLVVAQEE